MQYKAQVSVTGPLQSIERQRPLDSNVRFMGTQHSMLEAAGEHNE